jgi:hypothetical protein
MSFSGRTRRGFRNIGHGPFARRFGEERLDRTDCDDPDPGRSSDGGLAATRTALDVEVEARQFDVSSSGAVSVGKSGLLKLLANAYRQTLSHDEHERLAGRSSQHGRRRHGIGVRPSPHEG